MVDLGYARLDTDRAARTGDPEVVYGGGKTPQQVVEILRTLHLAHPDRAVLATRLSEAALDAVVGAHPDAVVGPGGTSRHAGAAADVARHRRGRLRRHVATRPWRPRPPSPLGCTAPG